MPLELPVPADPRPMQPHERVRHDSLVAQASYCHLKGADMDDGALMAAVSIAPGSGELLRPSLHRLLAQSREIGRRIVVLVGLNNNAEFPIDAYDAEVVDVQLQRKLFAGHRSKMHDTDQRRRLDAALTADHSAVIAMHEPQSPHAPGKIRMMNTLVGAMLGAIHRDTRLPANLLLMDAESQFTETPEPGDVPDMTTNGLRPLYTERRMQQPPHIVGARTWNAVYTETDDGMMPDFTEPIGPVHRRMNRTHGHPGHTWLTGGGILGGTAESLAVLHLTTRYGGLRADDAAMHKIAHAVGFRTKIADYATATNRVPGRHDPKALEQLARWHAGKLDLDAHYGADDAALGLASSKKAKLRDLLREMRHPGELVRLLWQKHLLNKRAASQRGEVIDGPAVW